MPRQKRISPRQNACFHSENIFSSHDAGSTIRSARWYGEMRVHAALAHPRHINHSLDGENQKCNREKGSRERSGSEEGPCGQEDGGQEGGTCGQEGRSGEE